MLIVLKPDCLQQGRIGFCLHSFEKMGFKFTNLFWNFINRNQAENLYQEHKDKYWFQGLITFMLSGPCIVCEMHIDMEIDVTIARSVVKSIRDEYAMSIRSNILHCSDSVDAGERECSIFFGPQENVC